MEVWAFGEKEGVEGEILCFATIKNCTFVRRTASFEVFCVDVCGGVLAVGDFLKKNKKVAE